jgi:serine phosphatase RsbU (regulator of sigma subunit)
MIAGSVVDYVLLPKNTLPLDFENLAAIGMYCLSLFLYFKKKASIPFCFGIALYAFVFNFICVIFINSDKINLDLNFFRITVFIGFLATLGAYVINRFQPIIIAGIYTLSCLVFYVFHPDIISIKYLLVLFGAFAAFAFTMRYFVNVQEKTLSALNETNRLTNELNKEILQKNEEIISQNEELELQKKLLEKRNQEIISAIRFAKSIQQSVLPSESVILDYFSGYFIFNRPKAVISGDFFWMIEFQGKVFVAVVDCTGHGVPGALVSMVINTILGRAFNEIRQPNPAKILNYTNNALIREFKSNEGFQLQIGMDIALVCFDFSTKTLEYSGAFNPLMRIRNSSLVELSASRFIMGLSNDTNNANYENKVLDFEPGDKFYMFSDGIVDQFGGEKNKKFGTARFRDELISIGSYSMDRQNELIQSTWKAWKNINSQTDDILVLGLEI